MSRHAAQEGHLAEVVALGQLANQPFLVIARFSVVVVVVLILCYYQYIGLQDEERARDSFCSVLFQTFLTGSSSSIFSVTDFRLSNYT